jgi:ATP-dependent DNA helicase Rep
MSTLHAAKGLEFWRAPCSWSSVEEGVLPHEGDPDAPAEVFAQRIKRSGA